MSLGTLQYKLWLYETLAAFASDQSLPVGPVQLHCMQSRQNVVMHIHTYAVPDPPLVKSAALLLTSCFRS